MSSPLVAAASPLTADVKKLQQLEAEGVGAVVLKSIFEEQIEQESDRSIEDLSVGSFADAAVYFENYSKNKAVDDYLSLLEEARKVLSIPIVASLNCLREGNSWIDYAKRLENLGADALELNIFLMPSDVKDDSLSLEKHYLAVIRKVVKAVSIPVSVKLASYFTGMAHFLKDVSQTGVKGVVLFNRYFHIDFDIENLSVTTASALSQANEYLQSLRWVALMSGELNLDFSATTGVHSSETVIKMLLAGARSVQLCSVLMKEGIGVISRFHKEIKEWMEKKGFQSIEQFCGKMAQERSQNPSIYERHQYVKFLTGSDS